MEVGAQIRASGVSKVFPSQGGDLLAVDNVDLTIPAGQFVSIIGPSGCGKSTLLRMFADLESPSSGTIELGGISAAEARKARKYSFVFQAPTLLPWKSVLRNTALPLKILGVAKSERVSVAQEMLALVGLSGFEDRLPWQLSGGMQQRVSIARALTVRPPILLMDEPFGALDEITRDKMNQELLSLRKSQAQTVIFITHSISEAVFLSDRVIVMSARPGRIIADLLISLGSERTASVRLRPEFSEYIKMIRGKLVDAYDSTKKSDLKPA